LTPNHLQTSSERVERGFVRFLRQALTFRAVKLEPVTTVQNAHFALLDPSF
jgi:hypothetical protein